ncbi:MAG: glutaminyl-peptide cyclotransferase [Ginsengibacter sp.]
MKQCLLIAFVSASMYSCRDNSKSTGPGSTGSGQNIPLINYSVVNYYSHDTSLFTEGFLFHNGQLFESTGSPKELPHTKSLVGVTDLATGKFSKKIELDRTKYFGEGIVFLNNKLYQLTYTSQVGFIYDAISFKKTGQFKYSNAQGWSLTTDGKDLIMSDGTSNLTFINPGTLQPVRILPVTGNGTPQDGLNELEYIKGFIYANVWMSNYIVKINPADGKIFGRLDLSSLTFEARNKNPSADVLNGIAYDSLADKVYVTGKMWTNIYQINFAH